MVRIKLSGITVDIPYNPYPPQLITMSKLIESFQNNTHSLIESPTGTGKSLSILCSVLAYYEQERKNFNEQNKPFKIFVCSRTHKQIDQLVEQLRNTSYKPRITILGSKDQYCINSHLTNVDDKNTACADMIKKKACVFFNGKDRLVKRIGDRIFDIEELKKEGKKCVGCPYFAARGLQEDADVIFAPYNYLIDKNIREASEVKLDNAILIIDEAHNIEDCCRSAGSMEITSNVINLVSAELLNAIKRSALLGEIKTSFVSIMEIFKKLKDHSEKDNFDIKNYDSQLRIRKGKDIIKEFESMGISKEVFLGYKNAIQTLVKDEEGKELLSLNTVRLLQELDRVIGMVLFTGSESYAYCFTSYNSNSSSTGLYNSNSTGLFSENSENSKYNKQRYHHSNNDSKRYTYSLWLLDPSIMFLPLVSKIKSIALLSGTLTPFNSFCSELKFQFTNKIIAPHIMKSEQVFVANIRKGHLKQDLCGTYKIADTPEYLDQIARIIKDISQQVREEGGTLVFVPSYAFLNKLASRIPTAIAEPKEGGIERTMKEYKERILKKSGAILLCVYRGKAAEGIDFKDEAARAVVAIGIPYPSIKDPQIGLKKEYNDKSDYNGRMWYEAQAFRALNQALGRTIRHSKDWGSVFLLDSRFGEKRYQRDLPQWVVSNLKTYETYENSVEEFKKFVMTNKQIN